MKVLKNSRGFTLVEIMVAAGLLGVLAMGMNSYMSNAMRASKKVEQNFNALNLKSVVLLHLANTTACRNSFLDGANTATYTTGPRDIRIRTSSTDQANNTLIQAGQIYGEGAGRLRINSIRVQGFTGATSVAANMERGEVSLLIETQKINPGSSFGTNVKTETIKLGIVKFTNTSPVTPNQFVKCYTQEDLAYSGMCNTGLGGFWNVSGIPSCESININASSTTAAAITANTAGTGAAVVANGNVQVSGNVSLNGTSSSISSLTTNSGSFQFYGKNNSLILVRNLTDSNIYSQVYLYTNGRAVLNVNGNANGTPTQSSQIDLNKSTLQALAVNNTSWSSISLFPSGNDTNWNEKLQINTTGQLRICEQGGVSCQTNFHKGYSSGNNSGYDSSCVDATYATYYGGYRALVCPAGKFLVALNSDIDANFNGGKCCPVSINY